MKPLLIILVLANLLSCAKKEPESAEAMRLYTESMNIHDELMPRMDEMYRLERNLKSLRDSLLLDSTHAQQQIAMVRKTLYDLETASEQMMHWMHNIQDVPGEKEKADHEHHSKNMDSNSSNEQKPEDILRVQQQQKAEIESIKAAMENSIKSSQQLLIELIK